MKGSAEFSDDKRYRWWLKREWDNSLPGVLFIMLNPSTATADVLDPTVRRCVGYAMQWGFGSVTVCNLFALRSTDPKALYQHDHLVADAANRWHIFDQASRAERIVLAWGNHGKFLGQGGGVEALLRAKGYKLFSFGRTKEGEPKHPLYQRNDAELVEL